MANVTFAIDDELKPRLDKFPWVNWSKLAKKSFIKRDELEKRLKEINELLKGSKMTEKLALKLGRESNARIYEEYKSKG